MPSWPSVASNPPLSITQAASQLAVSRQRVHSLIRAGTLTATRPPGFPWMISAESVTRYQRERRTGRPKHCQQN